jgi:quercetin dioxygenase-like cupin family protein
MKINSERFIQSDHLEWENLGGGVSRQILGYDNQIMMVKVKFEKGAIGAQHRHVHVQTTYCASGQFEFTVEGEKKVINEGDGLYIAPNLLHGTVCLKEGLLIDVFSPVREDFLDGSSVAYFGDKK